MHYITNFHKEQTIRKLYSDLLYLKEGLIYFHDKGLSSGPIDNYYIGHKSNSSEYYIRIYTKEYTLLIDTLVVFCRDYPDDLEYASVFSHRGTLELDLKYKLSVDTCMALYEYNIVISCTRDLFHYDRVGIERSHTINNIINHE